jgi:hypothetical protein
MSPEDIQQAFARILPDRRCDIYNTTIRNGYTDDKSGEWKETTNFSPADLAVLSQLSS